MIPAEDRVEDDGIAVEAKGEVGGGEAMGVEVGVLDEDRFIAGDGVVARDIELAGRKIVDALFDIAQERGRLLLVSGG